MESPGTGELIIAIIITVISGAFLLALFLVFMRRKNKLLESQKKEKERFERELAETQIEIREETMRNISWELHDNIGQILTLAKVKAQNAGGDEKKMKQAARIIGEGLEELRTLSKIINPETIRKLNLDNALQMEMDRFNRLRFIDADLQIVGEPFSIDDKAQTIIFRILQEFFSNTIKHAQATQLNVRLEYVNGRIVVTASDNGIGFINNLESSGIGLKNMKNRAALIRAELKIDSVQDEGTYLQLKYDQLQMKT